MSQVARIDDYRAHPSGIYVPPAAATGKPTVQDTSEPDAPEDGLTQRVRTLEIEVAEREEIAALLERRAATHVESETTLRLRQESADAEDRRRELANPARIALRDSRAQWWTNLLGLVAAVLGLGWSTANVQATAAMDAPLGSPGWWLAWGVEPLISAELITVMGATAYLATRQVTVSDPWVRAAKVVPLAYTVTLNCWMSLPDWLITHPVMELLRGLLVHSVGPVVVVLLVHALPVLWERFVALHEHTAQNPPEQAQPVAVDVERARHLLAIARPAYQRGEITAGVSAISRYLRTHGHRAGTPTCQWIRDALKREVTP